VTLLSETTLGEYAEVSCVGRFYSSSVQTWRSYTSHSNSLSAKIPSRLYERDERSPREGMVAETCLAELRKVLFLYLN